MIDEMRSANAEEMKIRQEEAEQKKAEQDFDFNEDYSVVIVGSKFRVMTKNYDDKLVFLTKSDFVSFHENKKIKRGDKMVSAANYWLSSPNRKAYDDVVFDPTDKVPANVYNQFKGLPIPPQKGDCKIFKKHILEIICQKDKALYDYVMMWLAKIVQDPGGKRAGTALVLIGGEGTGKGKMVEWIGKLFKPHFLHMTDSNLLVGRFNSILSSNILVYADEALFVGDKKAGDKLKALITEDTLIFEMKGIDAVQRRSHLNLIIASNHNWVVQASKDARRFCVLEVSDRRKKDFGYFASIDTEMENGGLQALMYDLLQIKVDMHHLRKVPQTKGLDRQKSKSLGSVPLFWESVLSRGYIFNDNNEKSFEAGKAIDKGDLHEAYLNFCDRHREHFRESYNSFFRQTYGDGGVFPNQTDNLTKRTAIRRSFCPLSLEKMRDLFDIGCDNKEWD